MQAKNHNKVNPKAHKSVARLPASMVTTLVRCWSAQARCLETTGDGDHGYTGTVSLVLISVG